MKLLRVTIAVVTDDDADIHEVVSELLDFSEADPGCRGYDIKMELGTEEHVEYPNPYEAPDDATDEQWERQSREWDAWDAKAAAVVAAHLNKNI